MNQLSVINELPAELAALVNEADSLIQVRSSILKPVVLKLTQAMSRANGGLANLGDFVCEGQDKNFGKSITVIPLMLKESASLMFSKEKPPRIIPDGATPKDGYPACYTKDLIHNKDGVNCNKCPWGEYWNNWDAQPKCKLSIDMLCIPEGTNDVMVLQFRKSSHPAGKDLVNKIANTRQPPFMYKYTLKSSAATYENYRYQIVDATATIKTQLTKEELADYTHVITDFLKKRKDQAIDYDVAEADDADSSARAADNLPL